ncbi:hypothetical protein [Methanosphaerula palustris]|nr:hypothetical protein [Methanosphaerula palustris]
MDCIPMNPDPSIHSIHDSRRSAIFEKFPTLDNNARIPLIFGRYLNNKPEKFYSRNIFVQATQIYSDFLEKFQDELFIFLKNESRELNLANRNLSEINLLPIHDIKLPDDDDIKLINYCDYSILPNYLKLIEGVYRVIINPIVAFVQLEKGQQISNQKIFNRCENICKKYPDFSDPFLNTIRNGIAHGGIVYGNGSITFIDENKVEEYSIKQFIVEFDDLLDFCNAMMLAYLTFYYSNHLLFKSGNIFLPSSFLFEEIKEELSAPSWEVRGCIESVTYKKENQLIIYISDSLLGKIHLLFYLTGTVRGILKLIPFYGKEYSRFFFSFSSKYYQRGFLAVDRTKIQFSEKEGFDDTSILNAMEVPLIYHRNLIFNRLFFWAITILNGFKPNISFILKNQRVINDGFSMEPRSGQIFRYRLGVTIKVSLVIKPNGKDLETIIRKEFRKLINESIKYGRNLTPIYSIEKYLPVSLIHINVMSEDFRERKLESPGLIPELICTIKHYRKKPEKIVDIVTGIPEIIGDVRIVWNSRSGYPKTK